MRNPLRRLPLLRRLLGPEIAHGIAGIRAAGHRDYVGGLWDEIGPLQLRLLRQRGLMPQHVLLDVGCGSLRGGVHFIAYLEPGHYLGVDKEAELIRAGLASELSPELRESKQPCFLVGDDFPFEDLPLRPDFALAHSLFTHLPAAAVSRCLGKLSPVMRPGGELFATFFEARRRPWRARKAHDHRRFDFTREEMLELGRENGWDAEYLGDWGHPRHQMLVRYRARGSSG